MNERDAEDKHVYDNGPAKKKLRSVREYREKKRLHKSEPYKSPSADQTSLSASTTSHAAASQEEFTKMLKDAVGKICYDRLGIIDERGSIQEGSVPLWRAVSRMICQALLDKEARLPVEIRFNMSDDRLRDAALRRIQSYTVDYLHRKYPS